MPDLNLVDLVEQVKHHHDIKVNGDEHNNHDPAAHDDQPNRSTSTGDGRILNSNQVDDTPEKHIPHLSKLDMTSNRSPATHFQSVPSTPSMRTGPPRSLSYVYSNPGTPSTSRGNSKHEPGPGLQDEEEGQTTPQAQFRGALEVGGTMSSDKKGKKRESRFLEESWNPRKWFHDSPTEERNEMNFGGEEGNDILGDKPGLSRAQSAPQSPTQDPPKPGRARWGRLRSLIPQVVAQNAAPQGPQSVVAANAVNITDELIAGGLSTLMLRLWFERDEKGHRRIPVLLHRLRIRVSDSLHPLKGSKSVFRIECEYANGAQRWVVYRQLRDFLSLHAHYTISNTYNRNVQDMPEFPKTSECVFPHSGPLF